MCGSTMLPLHSVHFGVLCKHIALCVWNGELQAKARVQREGLASVWKKARRPGNPALERVSESVLVV